MDNDKNSNDSLISVIEISENESDIEINKSNKNKSNIVLKNVHRVVRNWRKCLACGEKKNLQCPSKQMRTYFMRTKKIYIEKNDRVCYFHSQSENWDICCRKTSIFSSKIIDEMVNFLLHSSSDETTCEPPLNIGLTVTEFKQILFELGIPENPTKSQKKVITSVKLYIERLYTGHTYKQLALRYKMSRVSIGQIVKRGRNILLQHFVPNHIGYKNCTRQWLKDHTTELARILYCGNNPEKIAIICDGTYVFTCNSKNYLHQKKIYSGQKRRHLFKIMKFVAIDGSIIDVFGPFPATKNDAEILKIIFEKSSLKTIFNAGDVILVDRGFRDAIAMLKKMHFDVKIPDFIEKGNDGQLTTTQCNNSRLITKMRFSIETANGRMKMKWNLFNKIIPSILKTNLMPDYKIGGAILNCFAKPIICEKDNHLDIGKQMLSRLQIKNDLSCIIRMKKFQRLTQFQTVPPAQLIFPIIDLNQIKQFGVGCYAIKQAISYAAHVKKLHGTFPVFTLPYDDVKSLFGKIYEKRNFTNPRFIFAKIDSRFRSGKIHKVYILFDGMDTNSQKFLFYCTCQYGKRTITCCSHITAVIWYFGCGRHQNNINPASHLDNFFDIDFD